MTTPVGSFTVDRAVVSTFVEPLTLMMFVPCSRSTLTPPSPVVAVLTTRTRSFSGSTVAVTGAPAAAPGLTRTSTVPALNLASGDSVSAEVSAL